MLTEEQRALRDEARDFAHRKRVRVRRKCTNRLSQQEV
jgi:hypothetical protein